MARRILERIHEVELQVSPEFQKEWPAPKVWSRASVGTDLTGHIRYRIVLRWPNKFIATALELFVPKVAGQEINVWAPGSTIKPGDWRAAMNSVKNTGLYPGGVYVYVPTENDPIFREVEGLVDVGGGEGPLKAFEYIEKWKPGDDAVIDYFKFFAGKTGDTGATGPVEPYGATGATEEPEGAAPADVFLSGGMKQAVDERDWIAVNHIDQAITSFNPIIILVEQIPIDLSTDTMKQAVESKFEELEFQVFWAPGIAVWKVWPDEGQDQRYFVASLNILINRLDELAYGEKEPG